MMTARNILAWNIKKLRVEQNLSQERLALDAGLERVSISQIERQAVNVGIDSVGKIAKILNVDVYELFLLPQEGETPPVNLRAGRRSQ